MLLSELSSREVQALRFIRNSLTQRAKSPSIREIQRELGYASPRSAALIVERLIKCRCLQRRRNGLLQIVRDFADDRSQARTVPIPLVGTAPCGSPLLAEENIEAMIPVSTTLAKPPHRYFLLRARGNSMDRANINDRDLVLVKQRASAENGDLVVAIIDDEATIKEFRRTRSAVVLRPKSRSSHHQPIILSDEFQIQGIVVATISSLE
jgi:repressor LexA